MEPQKIAKAEPVDMKLEVVALGVSDVAALAVHLMTNTAVTGATYDIDGGQQLIEA
jgi:hypothetical protein